jgi:hypothetical protein
MSVYFYAPIFHVAAVAEHEVTYDEGEETEHTVLIEEKPAELQLGQGDPVVEAEPVPGQYHYDEANDRYVLCTPDDTIARDGWVSKTYEQVHADYPEVF